MESGFLTSSKPPSSSSSSFFSSSSSNLIARPPICGRVDNAAQTILCALLPGLFHICIYHKVLFFNWDQLAMFGLLLAVPSLVIASRPNSLWWFDSPSSSLSPTSSNRLPLSQRIRRLIFLVAGAILLGCLEYRVIFFSFHHFIAAYPPWSYIFVTLAIYSLAYFVVAHFTSGFGIISKPISEGISTRDKSISLGAAMIGAGAIGLTLGTPLYFMPFPVLNAYFFVNFYYHKKFSDYLGFLITVTLFLVWFMRKTFWFLDYQFGEGGDTISLQTTAILLVSMFIFSFLVIGVAIVNQNQNLVGLFLFIHSLGVSALEHVMYVHQHEHDEVAYSAASFLPKDIVYPGYFVIFTSLVGSFLACRLESEKKISNTFSWLTASIYLSKFALLLAPLRFSHLAAFSLVASISPLYFFYRAPTMKRQLVGFLLLFHSRSSCSSPDSPFFFLQALTHAVVIGIAAFFTRRIIPARIAEMFTGEQPSESQALGGSSSFSPSFLPSPSLLY
jgi:hypothetical protein